VDTLASLETTSGSESRSNDDSATTVTSESTLQSRSQVTTEARVGSASPETQGSRSAKLLWGTALACVKMWVLARKAKRTVEERHQLDLSNLLGSGKTEISTEGISKEDQEVVDHLLALVEPGNRLGQMSEFAKAYATPDFAERIVRKHRSLKKCEKKFEQALQWRQENQELLVERKFTLGGDERVIGHDLEGRPVIYMCLKNQMQSGQRCLDQKVVTMVQAIETMRPGVEKTVHIWDLHGQQFYAADLSPTPLIRMMHSQDTYFAERLHEVVIVGMPKMAAALKDIVWPMVPERLKAKIRFFSPEQAMEYVQAGCPEEDAERILEAMKDNRDPNLTLAERKQRWTRKRADGTVTPLVSASSPSAR